MQDASDGDEFKIPTEVTSVAYDFGRYLFLSLYCYLV